MARDPSLLRGFWRRTRHDLWFGAFLVLGSVCVERAAAATRSAPSVADHSPELGAKLERVFPRLRFERPVLLLDAGDGSSRLFVVEQDGVVRVFETVEDPDSSAVFLDLRHQVSRLGNEEGLLGLAFHPEFADNGEFFVHYSCSIDDPETGRTNQSGVVSRFHRKLDDPSSADPDSEEILLVQEQPYRNHNGGTIAFGPDAYLYITFGDGGSANDPHGHGQNKQSWLGSILRIDVDFEDPGLAYSIPPDNPFALEGDDARPELYAIGLRNVWRFSFDRATGELWAADIGQNAWEEVDLIEAGGNYGWNRFEGEVEFAAQTTLATDSAIAPVAVYGRNEGISITGGFVYRGERFPEFNGWYFYGDYASGNLWRAVRGEDGQVDTAKVAATGRSIASFGEDADGELYVLSFDGGIYRIVPTQAADDAFAHWPKKLSATGLFTSLRPLKPAAHVSPYDLAVPFWSDGAEKTRYLAIPEGAKLGYRDEGPLELPVGATLIKNFEGRQMGRPWMLETRLIRRTEQGFEAASYLWDPRAGEATLAPEGRQFELYGRGGAVSTWHVPSTSECRLCHTDASGFVLGLTVSQLANAATDRESEEEPDRDDAARGRTVLEEWAERGWIDLPPSSDPVLALDAPRSGEDALEAHTRAWLDVNCAMCHQPGGLGNANIDLRRGVTLGAMGAVGVPPAQGDFGIANAELIAAGEPERSILLHRVQTLGDGRMPNVATHRVDEEGVALLRRWILSLETGGGESPDPGNGESTDQDTGAR